MKKTKCKVCKARITWVKKKQNKIMIIESHTSHTMFGDVAESICIQHIIEEYDSLLWI